jgi:hypothetical protein
MSPPFRRRVDGSAGHVQREPAQPVTHHPVWMMCPGAGAADSPAQGGRPLIESYQNGAWQTASLPASAGSIWTNLYGITVVGGTV